MTRIFVTLATMNALALLLTTGFGVAYLIDMSAGATTPMPDQPLGTSWHMAHFICGLFTAVLTLFVHCLIITYLLGTGRWVKEVARAYELPDHELPRLTRELKRQAFPPGMLAVIALVFTVASGAAAQTHTWPWWTHLGLAIITLILNAWAFWVEFIVVSANGVVMNMVMEEVNRKRQQAGKEEHYEKVKGITAENS